MHFFFAATRKLNLYFAVQIVLVAVFWPVAAFLLVQKVQRQRVIGTKIGQIDIERRLDSFRVEIERSAFPDGTAASVFEFRELFARYTGLARAANTKHSAASGNELFKLAAHGQADLASICLERKVRNRLLTHADAAREEFVSFIAAASINADRRLLSLASAMAESLDDQQTLSRLGELELGNLLAHEETADNLTPRDAVPAFVR